METPCSIERNVEAITRPHEQRVITERDELEEKLIKLDCFISSNSTYSTLTDMEQRLLSIQLSTMQAYHAVLCVRISLFKE